MKTGRKVGTKEITLKFIAGGYSIKMKRNKAEKILLHRVEYGSREITEGVHDTRVTGREMRYPIYSVKIKEKDFNGDKKMHPGTLIELTEMPKENGDGAILRKTRKYIVVCDKGMYVSGLFRVKDE